MINPLGILIGLAGAFSQSVSYLQSRHFVTTSGTGPRYLLVVAHVWMGLFSLIALPFLWQPPVVPLWQAVLPVVGCALFYFAGQASFFWTVNQIPASRVSPLLGFKIVLLALLSILVMQNELNARQWTAVVLATLAAVSLTRAGDRLTGKALLGVCLTCLGYASSDICIPYAIQAFDPESGWRASALSVSLGYLLLGLICLPFVPKLRIRKATWRHAFPFSVAWIIGMVCLFISIGMVGVVLAIILQSTRGIISIAMGKALTRSHLMHLEQSFEGSSLARQVVSAMLMTIAIGLYVFAR